MATFTGNKIKDTYQSIVKAIDNLEVGATDKILTDGVGNELGLHVNTEGDFRIEGDLRIDGAIKDSLNSPGTTGQLLKSTLTGTDWVDVSSLAVTSLTATTGIDADFSQGDVTISLNTEGFQDIIGAMVSGNTETNITVTYDDVNGKLNFSVDDLGEVYTADGSTIALNLSNQFSIPNGGIGTDQIADRSITNDKIAYQSIGPNEMKIGGDIGSSGEVLTSNGDGNFSFQTSVSSITTDGIIVADDSTGDIELSIGLATITTFQLVDDAITSVKIAANTIGPRELKIDTNGDANQAIVSDGDGTFSYSNIVSSISTDSVLSADVSFGAVTISLNNNSITTDQLDLSGYGTPGQMLISDGDGSFSWTNAPGVGGETSVNVDITTVTQTGDNSSNTVTLPVSMSDENDIMVYLDGVYQTKDNFSVSGTTLTLVDTPATGVAIEVVLFTSTSVTLVGGSGSVNHLPIFTQSAEVGSSSVSEANEILDIDLTGALTIPMGTTAERPATPGVGMIRYNSTLTKYELYNGSAFVDLQNVYTAGNGISVANNIFTVAAGSGLTQDTSGLSHDDTSTQSSITASSRTYVTGVTLDTFGHVTGLTTGTETVTSNTYTNGSGLTLSANEFSHANTSDASSVSASTRRYIKSVTLDEFGHVTALTTGTETVTDTTYSATGNGLDLAGTVFSHSDTSTLSDTVNSGRTYIQNVTVDEFGHLTGVTTATETAGEGSIYTAGNGLELSQSNEFRISEDIYGIRIIGTGDQSNFIYFLEDNSIQFFVNGQYITKMESDGDLHVDGDVIAFSSSTSSDERLKDNIKTIENASDKIKQLKGVEFTWKKNGKNGGGVIAQDVEKVLPGAVKEVNSLNGEQTYKTVDYNAVIGLLIETNKELLKRIEQLENKK